MVYILFIAWLYCKMLMNINFVNNNNYVQKNKLYFKNTKTQIGFSFALIIIYILASQL